jgi:hypothetical protein
MTTCKHTRDEGARTDLVTVRSYIEGPKSAHVGSFLRKLAISMDLDITLDTEKRWFNETVYFKVIGPYDRFQSHC